MIIRDEQTEDRVAVRDIVTAAFERAEEARLVERLRRDGDGIVSLVAVDGDEIVGYLLLSRMTAPVRALGLGPVAVRPERQCMGMASSLIRAGIDRAKQAGWQIVFVLGEPRFYRRFGFDSALASGVECRYSGPHFMALVLDERLQALGGRVAYAPAFASLD
jgi:putative acetyltransferase